MEFPAVFKETPSRRGSEEMVLHTPAAVAAVAQVLLEEAAHRVVVMDES